MSSELNVYQRIHNVMTEIETIGKNGRNDFHKYDYATEADYVHALRPLLKKHGLVVIPNLMSAPMITETGITSLAMKFTIVNIDKPEDKVESIIPAQGQDKGDKGVYKALTGAKKYFAALTFMVATGDDPEKEDRKGAAKAEVKPSGKDVTLTEGVTTLTPATRRPSFRKNVTTPTTTNGVGDDI